MSRKTVRVDMHKGSPEALLRLANDIVAKHIGDGASSPLSQAKLSRLQELVNAANAANADARNHDAEAQARRQQRDNVLGLAPGQTAVSRDTVLNLVSYVRDYLRIHSEGHEDTLEKYGFGVVVGSAKTPRRAAAQEGVATT